MENQIIILHEIPDWAIEFSQKPNGIKKALEYQRTDRLKDQYMFNVNIKVEDGIIYFSKIPYKIAKRPNNVYHLSKTKKGMSGFTVNKNGTLQVWWNQDFNTAFSINILNDITQKLGLTWISEAKYLHAFLSKGNFGKILQGKIKNPSELAIQIVKSHKLDVNPTLFLKLLKMMSGSSTAYDASDKHLIIRLLRHSINADAFIERLVKYHQKEKVIYETAMLDKFNKKENTQVKYTFSNGFYSPQYEENPKYSAFGNFFADKDEANSTTKWSLINDVLQQLDLLGHKMNLLWSYKRLNEEHNKWSAELLSYEIEDMDDEAALPFRFSEFFDDFEDKYTSVVDTRKKAFAEGKMMRHCFYNNYWDKVKQGRYLTYHTTYGGVDGTLSIVETFGLTNDKYFSLTESDIKLRGTSQPFIAFRIDQYYGKSNKTMSEEAHNYYQKKLQKANERFVAKLKADGVINVNYTEESINSNELLNFW